MVQLIELKQFHSRLLLIKAWDGTTPDFAVSTPSHLTSVARNDLTEIDNPIVSTLSDLVLEEATRKQKAYILVNGDKTAYFYDRKPNDLVLIINAKVSLSTHKNEKKIQIELGKSDVKVWVKRFEKNTNLGQLFMDRIKSTLLANRLPFDIIEVESVQDTLVTGDSFEVDLPRNQIIYKDTFDDFELLKNYEIRCSIQDVFPLEYTIFDLIGFKCTECGLDESVQDLFEVDFEGLRKASDLHLIEYGPDKKEFMCVACNKPTAYFRFKIIFLLEDRTGDYLFALFDGIYAERYFQIKPIEVLAKEEKEYVFKNKFEELKEIFNFEKGYSTRSMVIFKDAGIYKIKAINFKRNV